MPARLARRGPTSPSMGMWLVLGTLDANNATLVIDGAVSGGKATLEGTGEIEFGGPSAARVTFAANSNAMLKLDDPLKFTGTIFGLTTGDFTRSDQHQLRRQSDTQLLEEDPCSFRDGQCFADHRHYHAEECRRVLHSYERRKRRNANHRPAAFDDGYMASTGCFHTRLQPWRERSCQLQRAQLLLIPQSWP